MARPKAPPWKPPYQRYIVHFFNAAWEEIPHLRDGPVSAVGVVNIVTRYLRERELIDGGTDVVLSPFIDAIYCGVSPYEEEEVIYSSPSPKLSKGSNRSQAKRPTGEGSPPDAV